MVKCLYCGAELDDHAEECPHCGAPSHFVKVAARRRRRIFLWVFLGVVVLSVAGITLLPR